MYSVCKYVNNKLEKVVFKNGNESLALSILKEFNSRVLNNPLTEYILEKK